MHRSVKNWRMRCLPKSPNAQIQDAWGWSLVDWDFANRELCCAGLYVAILSVLVDCWSTQAERHNLPGESNYPAVPL